MTLLNFKPDFAGATIALLEVNYLELDESAPYEEFGLTIGFAPGGSQPSDLPSDGLKIERFASPSTNGKWIEDWAEVWPRCPRKPFSVALGNSTLSAQATAGATTLSVANATGFAVGQMIVLDVGSGILKRAYEITAIVTTTLTLDRGVDQTFASGTTVKTWQRYPMRGPVEAKIRERFLISNLDSSGSRKAAIVVEGAGAAGWSIV